MVGVQMDAPQVPISRGEVWRAKYSKARCSRSLVAESGARDRVRPFLNPLDPSTPLTGQTHDSPRTLQRPHEGLASSHFRRPALHLKQPLRDLVVPKRRCLVGSRLIFPCGGWRFNWAFAEGGAACEGRIRIQDNCKAAACRDCSEFAPEYSNAVFACQVDCWRFREALQPCRGSFPDLIRNSPALSRKAAELRGGSRTVQYGGIPRHAYMARTGLVGGRVEWDEMRTERRPERTQHLDCRSAARTSSQCRNYFTLNALPLDPSRLNNIVQSTIFSAMLERE